MNFLIPDKEPKLKPCLICGDTPRLGIHDIFCHCGAKISIHSYVDEKEPVNGIPTYEEAVQEMIDRWNTCTQNDFKEE